MNVALYNQRVMVGAQMEELADIAIRTALNFRQVSHLCIPVDVQTEEVKKGRTPRDPAHHTNATRAYLEHMPSPVDMEHAADILNRGKRIAIFAESLHRST
jgi:pyruvate dehydrogenase (quinone)